MAATLVWCDQSIRRWRRGFFRDVSGTPDKPRIHATRWAFVQANGFHSGRVAPLAGKERLQLFARPARANQYKMEIVAIRRTLQKRRQITPQA